MSSSDNDPKKAEEMSLAELLGNSEAASPTPETTEEESDDDKSGLINLSQMAALLSQPPQTPTQPQSPQEQQFSSFANAQNASPAANAGMMSSTQPMTTNVSPVSSGIDTNLPYSNVARPSKKKSRLGLAIAASALIAGGIGAYVVLSDAGSNKTEAIPVSALKEDITKADSSVETTNSSAAAATALPATNKEAASEEKVVEETGKAVDEDEGAENDADYEVTEEEVDDGKGGKKKRKVRKKRTRVARTATARASTQTAKAAAAPAKSKASPPPRDQQFKSEWK